MDWILDSLTTYTPLGTTSNYSATANLHNLQITTARSKTFPACFVLTSLSLAAASYSGDSSAFQAQVLFSQPPMQLFSIPSICNCQLSALELDSQLILSVINSAGLRSCLYSLWTDPTENIPFNNLSILDMFADPLPRNCRLLRGLCPAAALYDTLCFKPKYVWSVSV
jgi:hypothetical protein